MGNVLGITDNLKQWEPNDVQEIKCVIEKGFPGKVHLNFCESFQMNIFCVLSGYAK
jgi:hypothetical protein